MKSVLSTLIVLLTVFVAACAPIQTSLPANTDLPTDAAVTMPADTQPVVESTAQVSSAIVEMPSATPMPLATASATAGNEAGSTSGSAIPAGGVTLSDNGKTFVMHVGESFLLNLGMDVYDWSPEVDNQNVLQRKMGVMVIRGAQAIYDAKSPGTATLTANGNPLCLQSTPPCMMPSILFSITVIVQ